MKCDARRGPHPSDIDLISGPCCGRAVNLSPFTRSTGRLGIHDHRIAGRTEDRASRPPGGSGAADTARRDRPTQRACAARRGLAEPPPVRQHVRVHRDLERPDRLPRTPEDYRQVALAYAAEAAAQGAVYVEAIIDAEERFDDWAGVLAACCDAAAEAAERHGVTIGLTPQIYRGYDTARGEEAARVATRFAGRGVVGFGLSGAEGRKPTRTARACGAGSTGWWVALRAARRRGGPSAIGA